MKTKNLFSPTRLGPYTLKNRVVLPPLTRSRSSQPGDIPNELMAEYYAQRSSAGFMVTEGTQIEPRGQGYAWTPGIYSSRQVEGWKKVTRAVHEKEGIIFAQLWHVGRVSHNSLQPGNASPVAPSAIPAGENVKVFIETGPGEGALATASCPRALEKEEISEIVRMYAGAAQNALDAGFDGVEIHCANGYLVNQFMSSHSNKREDEYGGSLHNRLRFLREVTQAVADVVGKDRTLTGDFTHAEAVERRKRVRPQLDPGANFANFVRLLQQHHLDALTRQRQRGGCATNTAADNNCTRNFSHDSSPFQTTPGSCPAGFQGPPR